MGLGFSLSGESTDEPKQRHALEHLNKFLSVVHTQDDAAMVLSLATFIEESLGRLLLSYFRTCKATKDLIEGFNAPLGTLGSRIKAAYSFGLVTEDQYKDLEILRKVRNQFAHNWEGVSLERNDIQAMIGQLSCYTFTSKPIEGNSREKLLGTISTCCVELQIFLARIEAGKAERAPDVSHRLSTMPPTEPGYRRFVK